MIPLSSLWLATSPSAPDLHAFEPGVSFDVVVIGAGFTGLSAALHIAAKGGARVAVLDERGPGMGTSGEANGQVIAGLQQAPDHIVAVYGAEMGERTIDYFGAAPDLFRLD